MFSNISPQVVKSFVLLSLSLLAFNKIEIKIPTFISPVNAIKP